MDLITTPVVFGQSPPENSIVHSTSVSLTNRSPSEPVHLVQYDDTLPMVAVALTSNGQPYTVPSGAAVNVRLAKPDRHYVYDPAYGVSDNGQTAYIAVTVQMTAVSGKVSPIIGVVVNGTVAGTGFFVLDIDPNPIPEDAIESTDEFKTIQQLAAEVTQAAQSVTDNLPAINAIGENIDNINAVAQNSENISAVGGSIANVNSVAENLTPIQTAATNIAAIQQAPQQAANAAASATLSESWAVGGTGTREGENTNNAKYYAEQAQQVSQGAVGWYETEQALQAAHPTGQNGQWAIIGTTDTVWTWDSDTNTWVDTGSQIDMSQYYTKNQTNNIIGWLYKATFNMDGWSGSESVSQTVSLTPVDGGPGVTSGSTLLACVGTDSTLPQQTKDAMAGAAAAISQAAKTLGSGTITATLNSAPAVDVELYFYIKPDSGFSLDCLSPVIGHSGITLLWKNPNPNSPFAPQTVSVPVSDYDLVSVGFYGDSSTGYFNSPVFMLTGIGATGASMNSGTNRSRIVTLESDGLSFQNGYVVSDVYNNVVVPIFILGIKL